MNKHINIKIQGQVQGVGFRFSVYEKFVELGMQGKAENTADGGVFVDLEGSESGLEHFIEWCNHGPMGARVSNVEVTEMSTAFVPLKMG